MQGKTFFQLFSAFFIIVADFVLSAEVRGGGDKDYSRIASHFRTTPSGDFDELPVANSTASSSLCTPAAARSRSTTPNLPLSDYISRSMVKASFEAYNLLYTFLDTQSPEDRTAEAAMNELHAVSSGAAWRNTSATENSTAFHDVISSLSRAHACSTLLCLTYPDSTDLSRVRYLTINALNAALTLQRLPDASLLFLIKETQ